LIGRKIALAYGAFNGVIGFVSQAAIGLVLWFLSLFLSHLSSSYQSFSSHKVWRNTCAWGRNYHRTPYQLPIIYSFSCHCFCLPFWSFWRLHAGSWCFCKNLPADWPKARNSCHWVSLSLPLSLHPSLSFPSLLLSFFSFPLLHPSVPFFPFHLPQPNTTRGFRKPNFIGHIEFRDVSFTYPSRPDTTVLDNVNLSLSPGTVLALVGPSGGGKSTIVSLVERFYDVSGGTILLDGVDIRTIDPSWFRYLKKFFSFLFFSFFLPSTKRWFSDVFNWTSSFLLFSFLWSLEPTWRLLARNLCYSLKPSKKTFPLDLTGVWQMKK